ncbi:MAG: hypothetical protein EXQ55_05935 [Acidobacteria bacterium]|nr:hypothetical protein [Acidobacteriota bacterium]
MVGFLAEFVYKHWLHSTQPMFQLAINLSSGLFLLLYGVTVTVHVVEYVWGKFGGTPGRGGVTRYVPWALAAFGVLAAAFVIAVPNFGRGEPPSMSAYQSSIEPPEDVTFVYPANSPAAFMALSPDARRLAFIAAGANGQSLWIRQLDGLTAQPLSETTGALHPFWSPDSRFVAFFADGKLKRIAASGGPATIVTDAIGGGTSAAGGSWSKDDVILFRPQTNGPLYRVSASGGETVAATTLDATTGETAHGFPFFLPDGRHFL